MRLALAAIPLYLIAVDSSRSHVAGVVPVRGGSVATGACCLPPLSRGIVALLGAGGGVDPPVRPPISEVPLSGPEGFVFVDSGTFVMGSPPDELGRSVDEGPQHRVQITKGFWMSSREVTQEEYRVVTGTNPSTFDGVNQPVESVSWNEAVEFCNGLSRRDGLKPCYSESSGTITCDWGANGYRLPTEAEWEYACRAGAVEAFYTGPCTVPTGSDPALDPAGWYEANSGNQTHDVGQKQPNRWGLYDMHGNVCEWCWDSYGPYSSEPSADPRGAPPGSFRAFRGGCWASFAGFCRSATRSNCLDPSGRWHGLGFRVVRNQSAAVPLRNAECGIGRVGSQQSAVGSQQSAVSSQQSAVSSQQSAVSSQQSAVSSQQSAVSSRSNLHPSEMGPWNTKPSVPDCEP